MESIATKADGTEIMTEDVWFTTTDIDLTQAVRSENGSNIVDLTNGNEDKIKVDMDDVLDLVDADNQLIIKGDLEDKIVLDNNWETSGKEELNGVNYNVYQGIGANSTIKLLIEDDLDVTPDI